MNGMVLPEGDSNRGGAREQWYLHGADTESRDLLERDANVFVHQSLSTPCLESIVRSDGPYLWTSGGRRLLDFHGNAVHAVGYGHPRVKDAVFSALDELPFCPRRYTNSHAVTLAERLVARAGGELARILFAPSASLCVSMALRAVRRSTGRFRVLSMWDSFHGAGLDAGAAGGEALFRTGFGPLMEGVEHFPPLAMFRPLWGDTETYLWNILTYIEYMITVQGDVGAVLMEPIRNTDVQVPPVFFHRELRRICTAHRVALIYDETAVGMGRTGSFFAYQRYGVTPDAVILGKSLGGGIMPIAAVIMTESLAGDGAASMGHFTHEKSPAGCAAGNAVIDIIDEENLCERAETLGALLEARLRAMRERHQCIVDIRRAGLLLGLELGPTEAEPDAAELAERVLYGCLARGLSFKVSQGTVLQLCPALTIAEDELLRAASILEETLLEIC